MTRTFIKQVPLPGGSGHVQTGAMQFQEDWPGLFIRGDDAIALLREWRDIQHALDTHAIPYFAIKLDEIAAIIERDVKVGPASA